MGSDVYTPDLGDFSGAGDHGAVDSPDLGGFVTLVQEWGDCGPERSRFHVALLWPESFAYTALVQVVTLDSREGTRPCSTRFWTPSVINRDTTEWLQPV